MQHSATEYALFEQARFGMEVPSALQRYQMFTTVDGVRMHCYFGGLGATGAVVLVHGLGDEADTWRHVFPALCARYRVVLAPDLPGFGRSDQPRRAYTSAFYAQMLLWLLDMFQIERATFVGSSMGAMIVQRLALAEPARVEQLVLLDGALPLAPRWPAAPLWSFLTPGLGEWRYTSLRRSQDQAYATLRPYYADLDRLSADDQAFLRQRVWARVWSSGQRRAFLSALRWLAVEQRFRAASFRARLTTLTTPTTLVWGDTDYIVPQALGEAHAALLPNAQFQLIEQCGHLPQQERPEAVLRVLGG